MQRDSLITNEKFQDFQAHIEFMCNENKIDNWQQNGNSGFYIQQRYELQVLNSPGIEPHPRGCGGIYKLKAPAKNMSKSAGQWQSYDMVFRAARFQDGKKTENARISVIHNGTLIHDDFEIPSRTGAGKAEGPAAGPIRLQYHGNAVKFRNFWLKPLNL